ncbi:MAG: hypothetical protein ABIP90_11295 [Vicinamibacterales bacterium]
MFGSLGFPELFPVLMILGIFIVPLIGAIVLVWLLMRNQRRIANRLGYASLSAYLRAAPQTDEEKRAAVDLALKGLVICLLGLIMPPILLLGLFPLFYGVRKMIYASMGLGLVDDARR